MGKNGFPMGGGGGNMQQMLRQAQKMQADMQRVQEELEEMSVEASAGGGMVKAVVSGSKSLINLTINPEAINAEDAEMLQDMIMAAVNEAMRQAEELSQKKMGQVTGGLNLGGLF